MRTRDRRARGLRGPLAPRAVPLSRSRAAAFDDDVVQALERLQARLPELAEVELVVAEVPPGPLRDGSPDPVPLGSVSQAGTDAPACLTVYRKPVELRARPGALRGDLIADVVAELVAELLGITPHSVDHDYLRHGT